MPGLFFGGKDGEGHLDAALAASLGPPCCEPAIVTAYRKAGASAERYPNTAELLRAVIGTDRLSGGITERDRKKCDGLADAWNGSRIVP